MQKYLRWIKSNIDINLIKTITLALSKKCKCILVFPNTFLYTARSSSISGKGLLSLGRKWRSTRFMPSEFGLEEEAKLIVNGRFNIRPGFHLVVNRGATLTIGSGNMNNKGTIDCFQSITIGDNVHISKGVTIRDSDNHYIDENKEMSAPIVIEDNVLVSVNVTILKGVRIGSGSVVAAGAVVTRDVPKNCLVAGVPARVIKENIAWHV
jgi:acetyltransferase-like isoleucine patch superfamily enzyme